MEKLETAKAIEADAVQWVALIDRVGDQDAAVQAQLVEWLGDDARRMGAYFRASVAWHMLDRASVLGQSGADAGFADDEQSLESGLFGRRKMLRWGGGALAATIVAGMTGITLLSSGSSQIETEIGEIRRVPLADGSMASVNTQTKIAFDFKLKVRRVELDQGEAWFRVAKDAERPFVVEAGDVRARAVGTAFSVRKMEAGVLVQVTEGRVAVWRVGDEAHMQFVDAGSRAFVNDVSSSPKVIEAAPQIDRSLSWRQGELAFDGDTVGEAASEFNRYNKVQMRVEDPGLAAERLVGRFRTDEPDAFAKAVSTMLGASAQTRGDEITLTR